MGQILQAGQGQLTARQAAAKAGIPLTTPPIVLNKLCPYLLQDARSGYRYGDGVLVDSMLLDT